MKYQAEQLEAAAKKLPELLSHGLVDGVGRPIPGKMCVEAAVCYAMGLPHGDEPVCVSPAVREFKITLNDSRWSSNEARAKGMLKLALAQLGSDAIDDQRFTELLAIKTVNTLLPVIFADLFPEYDTADMVAAKTLKAAGEAAVNAAKSAYAAAYAAYAAYAAANAAADAAKAAAYAAAYAAYAADAAANAAARAAYADKYLNLSATIALDVLIEMDAPGIKFLRYAGESQ